MTRRRLEAQMRFDVARENHAAVDSAASDDVNAAMVLWAVLTEGTFTDPRGDMVLETMPEEYAALMRTDEIAASYAFSRLWSSFKDLNLGGFDLREAFRGAWAAFAKQASQADTMAEGFGWDRSCAWQSYRELVGSDIDTASVTRIAKLAGQMYAAIRGGALRPIMGVPAEITDISFGGDLSRMVGSEYGMLAAGGILTDLEFVRVVTDSLVLYETKGEDETAKGPLVLCRDESGSMHGPRHEWAAAAMIALSRVAADEHRQVAVVHFSTSVVVHEFDAGDPASVAKLIKSHLSGGTDIARALRAASKKAAEWAKNGAMADVVLLTDGIDYGNDIPAAVEAIVEKCRLWTVAIDCDIPAGNCLRDRAAEYVYLSGKNGDLIGDAAVGKVLPLGKAAQA